MGVNSNRVEHFACPETTLTIPAELGAMQIHDVCLPPEKTTFHKLKHRLSEIFFPDDPLYRFKNQTCFNKLILALQFFFPIFQWGSEYNVSLLRSDVISGLTIASLAIPQVRETMKLLHHPLSLFVCVCLFFFFVLITGVSGASPTRRHHSKRPLHTIRPQGHLRPDTSLGIRAKRRLLTVVLVMKFG
jgi:hypothetical protein